ncbi:MAG: phytoene desaturase family protein [Pleomorphochaeta sp.]
MKSEKQIIIVGAGLAGLTSAAYLSKEGYKVLLIEKNNTCGGLLSSFNHEGFTFDVGARSIENSGIIKPLLKDLEIDIELLRSKVSIGIESDILSFTETDSIAKYKSLLIKKFPQNTQEIEKIFKVIYKITKSMETMYGFDNPIFTKDFTKDKEYLLHKLLPWFPKFLLSVIQMNKMNKPIDEFLKKYTSNQSLIDMISQHFFKKTPTFFALGYFYVYQDYLYPKGGTGKISEKLKDEIIKNGGKILNNTLINSIDTKAQSVIANNINYNYDNLIWAADLKQLYSIIKEDNLSKTEVKEIKNEKAKLFSSRGGDSVFTLYLGVNKDSKYFSKISNEHFFYTPLKNGLNNTHYAQLEYLITNFEKHSKEDILKWIDQYTKLNTYEISIPVLRDTNLAPKNQTGLIINFFFEYNLVKKIYEAGWYETFKTEVENKMIEVLNNSIYPFLKDNLLFQFSYTPLSIERIVKTSEGAITGWTYEKESPVVNNLLKISKSIKTPIENIYQAGQWVYSPSGIPTAILTGWYAASEIKKTLSSKN